MKFYHDAGCYLLTLPRDDVIFKRMAEYIAEFAPDNLPEVEYSCVNWEQVDAVRTAMELPKNQEKFEVSLLPVETIEQRRAAAEEWAGYNQAAGQVEARRRGAFLIASTRDESPERFLRSIEDKDKDDAMQRGFVTCAVMKILIKTPGASTFDLFHAYYGLDA